MLKQRRRKSGSAAGTIYGKRKSLVRKKESERDTLRESERGSVIRAPERWEPRGFPERAPANRDLVEYIQNPHFKKTIEGVVASSSMHRL